MKQGTNTVALVFVGVLAVTAGLGFFLYQAGKPSDDATAPDAPPPGPVAPHGAVRPPGNASKSPPFDPTWVPPPLPDGAGDPSKRKPTVKPRFHFEGHDDVDRIDWEQIGTSWIDVMAAVHANMDLAEVKWPPGPDTMKHISEAMTRYMAACRYLPPPGTTPPKQTDPDDPAFAANRIAAVLDALKMPLTDAQARRIETLALERAPVIVGFDPRHLPDDPTIFRLDVLVRRADAVDAFYAEALATLTPAQVEALIPSKYRGRVRGDMFSAGGVLMAGVYPVPVDTPAQVTDFIVGALSVQFDVRDRTDEMRAIVDAWVREGAYEHDPPDIWDQRGFIRVSRIVKDSRRMADLLHRLVDGMKLTGAAAESARETPSAYVPLIRTK